MDSSNPSSSTEVLSAWWKSFWAIKIPRKILMFAWRGYHEILPTTKGLYRRNVSVHSNCPICGYGEDSNAHTIFWCPFSQELWVLLEYPFLNGQKEEISFKNILLYATELLEKDDCARMIITAWVIWFERNKVTHGQQQRTPQQMKSWISLYYEELKRANALEGGVVSSGRERLNGGRTEIEIHDFTLYVDASISTIAEKVGLGAVIFTTYKRNLATLSKPLEGTLSVFHAEALALLVGLRWAQFTGLPIKLVSTDSLSLVQALNNKEVYHNELGILLTDINGLLTNLPSATISHMNREFNFVAHNLAKQALQLEEEDSWISEIPHLAENHN